MLPSGWLPGPLVGSLDTFSESDDLLPEWAPTYHAPRRQAVRRPGPEAEKEGKELPKDEEQQSWES